MPDSMIGWIACGIHIRKFGAISGIRPKPTETATTNRLLRDDLKSTVDRMRTPVAATMPNITRPAPPSTKVGTASTSAPIFGIRPSTIMITPPMTQT